MNPRRCALIALCLVAGVCIHTIGWDSEFGGRTNPGAASDGAAPAQGERGPEPSKPAAPIKTTPFDPGASSASADGLRNDDMEPEWRREERRRLIRNAMKLTGLEAQEVQEFLSKGGDAVALLAAVRAADREIFRKKGSVNMGVHEIHRRWSEQHLTERTPLIEQSEPCPGKSIKVNGRFYRFDQPTSDYEGQRVTWDIKTIDGLPFLNVSRIDPGDDPGHDARQASYLETQERIRRELRDLIASANQ